MNTQAFNQDNDGDDLDPFAALEAAQNKGPASAPARAPTPTPPAPRPQPAAPAPGARNMPTGPACPACGPQVHTWANTTKSGKQYYRCSRCKDAWWPGHDDAQVLGNKWPPFDPAKK